MPSLTQIILPQFIQFGAASSSGCRVAMQLHFRLALSTPAERVGLVWISSARIADSRSFSAVDAPCMGVPPATLTFALGFGEELRDDFVSEISWPAADGGSLDGGGAGDIPLDLGVDVPEDVMGFWIASGLLDRAKVLALGAFGFEELAM